MTLRQYREAIGITQQELDKAAGLTIGTVTQIENGRNTNPTWLVVRGIIGALQAHGLKNLTAEDVFPEPVRSR